MFIEILLVLFVLWMMKLRWQRSGLILLAGQLKNSFYSLPFIGHSYLFFGGEERRMKAFQLIGRETIKQEGITAIWHAYYLLIFLADPVAVDFILKNSFGKGDIENIMQPITGNGSIFAPVSIWRPRRKIQAPLFNAKNLARFIEVFGSHSTKMVDSLRQNVGKGTVSIWNALTTYTMGAMCETTLGVKFATQEIQDHPFLKAVDDITSLAAMRIYRPWLHSNFVFKRTPYWQQVMKIKKVVYDFIQKIIQEQHKILKEPKDDKDTTSDVPEEYLRTFLNMLINSPHGRGGYTDVELQEEMLVLIMAGTDTSAVAIAFTLLLLSRHLEVQEKVYQEIKEVFGDSDRQINNEDLKKLVYLDAVIKETMRLYPPVPAIVRKIENDIKLPSGVKLLEGCYVVIHIWALQRNPLFWGNDAEIFRPERFIDSPPTHPSAFTPFSIGQRGCIGSQFAMMSMKTALSNLLRQYRFLAPSEKKTNTLQIHLKFDIFLRDAGGYLMQLESRA